MIAEIYKKILHKRTHAKLYYYRTSHGVEIDLIIDHKRYLELIEIKKGETYHSKMIKAMQTLRKPEDHAFLLYNGENLMISDEVQVLNYQHYLLQ